LKRDNSDLDMLFDDRESLRLARLLSQKAPPQVDADPAFRSALRRQLMRDAWDMSHPAPRWWQQLLAPRGLVWAGATVGLVAVACLALLFAYDQFQAQQAPEAVGPSHPVAANQAFDLRFTTDMDHSSVEKAIRIEPATEVRYQWDGNTLRIVPSSGTWAANVQYRVTIVQSAESVSGKPLTATVTIPVSTEPSPSPSPTPTATPSQKPTPPLPSLADQRQLADVSGDHAFVAWSPDGQVIYTIDAQGVLSAIPTRVDQARPLTASGVSLAALSASGTKLVYVLNGSVWTVAAGSGSTTRVASADGQVLLVGWKETTPVWVTADSVFTPGGQQTSLPHGAQPLSISPAGDHLALRSGGVLKIQDVAGAADPVIVPQSAAGGVFLAWSPDGKRIAYQDGGQVSVWEIGSATKAGVNIQATAGAWSSQGQLLLAGSQGLHQVSAEGSGLVKLSTGAFDQLNWAPNGLDVAFIRSRSLWRASVAAGASTSARPSLEAGYARIDDFMRARMDGNGDQAGADLDPAGRSAYQVAGMQLLPAGLNRYYVVASQDTGSSMRFTVRLIFAKDKFEKQSLDETLILQPDSGGKLLIHSATAGARQDLGKSPQLTSVVFAADQLTLTFDSDLDPKTIADGVAILEADTGNPVKAQAAFGGARTVTVDTSRLSPGASYRLTILASLKDVGGRAVSVPYTLDFVAPAPAQTQRPARVGSPGIG
jgi:hypothetical protein